MAAARRWSTPIPASARPSACRSTTRSIRRRTSRCRPTRASPPTSPSSATACPTARRGWRSSSSSPPPRCPSGRFLIGGNGWETKAMPANVRHRGHVYTAEHNAFNATPLRGAQRRARQHGERRLFAGDARVRGGGRGGVPDHRRVGGDRAVPHPRHARCSSRATGRTSPSTSPPDAGAGDGDRPGGAGARAGRAHLCAARARRSTPCSARGRRAGGGGMRLVVLGLSLSSSWGNGHATTFRALLAGLRRARARGAVPRARRALVRRQARPDRSRLVPPRLLRQRRRARRLAARGRRRRRGDGRQPTSPTASRSARWVQAARRAASPPSTTSTRR